MNDEFDFSSSQSPEDPTMSAQKKEQTQPVESTAEKVPAETASEEGPAQDSGAQTAPAADQPEQKAPSAPADPYPNPFAPQPRPAAQPPYTVYPYTQPTRPVYPPYTPPQPNAQYVPYTQPTAPYQHQAPSVSPYAAQGAPYAAQTPPHWYAQQNIPTPPQNGAVPPVPPAAGGYTGAQPAAPAPKKKSGQVVLWVLAALLEVVIVGFAIYGVYSLATDASHAPADMQRPGYNQQVPGWPNNGGTASGEQDNSTSSATSNYTNVQLGIVCVQMKDEFWTQYGLEPGLVVQSISSDSNARNTDLREGDVITEANGTKVKTFDDLFAVMDQMNPGDEMKLTVYRPVQGQNGYTQGEAFTVTFAVKEKSDAASSSLDSNYPQA